MSLDHLDKKLWKKLKSNAGIKSTKLFTKADASVGKHIANMNKAKKKYQTTYMYADLLKYITELGKLRKSFDSFFDAKGLKEFEAHDPKGQLGKEIQVWKKQIAETEKELVKKFKAADGKIKDKKVFEQADAKSKKEPWRKMGFDI